MKNSNDNLVERLCPNCGMSYSAQLERLKYGRQTTCSRACSYALRTKQKEEKVPPPRKKTLYQCATCGKEIWRYPALVENYHGIFCSRECHYAGISIGATKRIVTKPYTYTEKGKAAQLAAMCNPNRKKKQGKRVNLTCLNCQKQFELQAWQRKNKTDYVFCSLDCCNAYRKGENNPAWRGGYPGYYGPDWRALQKAARKRDNYTCQRCQKDMHKPHRAPDVHHVKPVSSFPAESRNDANTLDNVVCLCHNCHMYVEWHGIDFAL